MNGHDNRQSMNERAGVRGIHAGIFNRSVIIRITVSDYDSPFIMETGTETVLFTPAILQSAGIQIPPPPAASCIRPASLSVSSSYIIQSSAVSGASGSIVICLSDTFLNALTRTDFSSLPWL